MKRIAFYTAFFVLSSISAEASVEIALRDYGVVPGTGTNTTESINLAISRILESYDGDGDLILTLEPGRYDFYPHVSMSREYFISNHDQNNPKNVGIELKDLSGVTLDGHGAELIMHGRMLPIALINSSGCAVRNVSIDNDNPQITQVTILSNDTVAGCITYAPAPWVKYEVRDNNFVAKGLGWEQVPCAGIAFEPATKHLVYNTSDIGVGTTGVSEISTGVISAPWRDARLIPGTVVAMRSYDRPTPAIFVDGCRDIEMDNVSIHYAEGMGLLAQLTENITLNRFNVCLRGDDDPRYFTTQADATHFSGCKGLISSVGGLYEGMMDDAVNVHGTYLKVRERVDSFTIIGEYMHHQSYGFAWGCVGDTVQFISSRTMDVAGQPNIITAITPVDRHSSFGAKLFKITFGHSIDTAVDPKLADYGVENLTWTPQVVFSDNIVRNNRARGALFSTPRKVVVEGNLFDHTSGTAILLCGDCNGWFETGACHDVTIRGNKFVNALTNLFQFTNAVISIYPEIPDLKGQAGYFHSGITITGNEFDTFDTPLLYAKSVDGLIFMDNVVRRNHDYSPLHWNQSPVWLERVNDARIQVVAD